jgi:chromosome segregation ATPase
MRDYNSIQFRSPRKVKDHPLALEDEKKQEATSQASSGTAPSTPSMPSKQLQGEPAWSNKQRMSPPPASPGVASLSSLHSMSAQDALAVRRDGAETTIVRLRSALEDSSAKDSTAKAALAKSDAVILELRSSVRQLKRQLDKVQDEREVLEKERDDLYRNSSTMALPEGSFMDARSYSEAGAAALDERIGELQVQLDRAHAQILTADMVRKELEDTLEAEQYTWELRVQDQERQIVELQQDCATLVADLEGVRNQWKEAEEGWTKQVDDLQQQLDKAQKDAALWRSTPNQSDSDETGRLKDKLRSLEDERAELQGCLDEALKELEAVDAELQGDPVQQLRGENEHLQKLLQTGGNASALTEPLQHLYRMMLEREGVDEDVHTRPRDARSLVAAIQSHVDRSPPQNGDLTETRHQVRELETQLSVYKGDLMARDESTSELRASLKEAVSLLKPLQDNVAKADREKRSLQKQISELKASSVDGDHFKQLNDELTMKEKEIDRLREEVETLELALTRAKAMAASSVVATSKTAAYNESPGGVREKMRKRREEEDQIRQMLNDARSRFTSLHDQNQEAYDRNTDLQSQLDSRSKALITPTNDEEEKKEWEHREGVLVDLQDELKISRGEIAKKEVEMRNLEKELEKERYGRGSLDEDDAVALREARSRVDFVERKLHSTLTELKAKKESERALNGSLKEALNLLRPLQTHLEEAEQEKKEMAKELLLLKKRVKDDASRNQSLPDEVDVKHVRDLEYAVQQLEKENSQLHDALEDMSHNINVSHLSGGTNTSKNEARAKEELVEMKSRYEVTQSRLEDAFVENHTLVEALQKREKEEKEMAEELHLLRQRLKQTQGELDKRPRSSQDNGQGPTSGYSPASNRTRPPAKDEGAQQRNNLQHWKKQWK